MTTGKKIFSSVLGLALFVSMSVSAHAATLAYITPPSAALTQAGVGGAVAYAVKTAGASETVSVVFKNIEIVNKSVLEAAFKQAGSKKLAVRFNQMQGVSVIYQIVLTSANVARLPKNVDLKVVLAPVELTNTFTKYFSNDIAAFKAPELGSSYTLCVKPKLPGPANIRIYVYDYAANTYSELDKRSFFIDKNGYLHITSGGGELIVSDGELARK